VPVLICFLLSAFFQPADSLSTQFQSIAATSGGRVGVYAEVLETGESAGINDDEHFPMQSVFKLPISIAILGQVEQRALTLDQTIRVTAQDLVPAGMYSPLRDAHPHGDVDVNVRDLIRDAIVDSDGTASDVLYRVAGGGPRITAYLSRLGVRDIAVVATEAAMGRDEMAQYRNFSTPRAAVELLKHVQSAHGISAASRDILLGDMIASTPGPHRLKGGLPKDTIVAHKTGTDGTHYGMTRATNDIGLVTLPGGRHLAIAVFVKDSTAGETTREATIARIAWACWDQWVRTGKGQP
jgi:beta-lactamase class A